MGAISIGWIDISIVVLYLIFIIWWGLRHGKSSDAGSYFLAGRSMPWWIVGLSLFAASISSTTLIGQCGDAYDTGVAVFNYNLTGVESAEPQQGINIKVTTYSDGTRKSEKVVH